MTISVFDLFSIGVGPSSSHTVGPMRAAKQFADRLNEKSILPQINRVTVELFGSLALTGRGHGTDIAVLMGLEGETPELIIPESIQTRTAAIRNTQHVRLCGSQIVPFIEKDHLIFRKTEVLPFHSNGMRLTAFNKDNAPLLTKIFYSVGGGFIVDADNLNQTQAVKAAVPYPFTTAEELLKHCQAGKLNIYDVMRVNEHTFKTEAQIQNNLLRIWRVMRACIEAGCRHAGILPGGLKVKRRAPILYNKFQERLQTNNTVSETDWLTLYAIAVNEENAAGGRVVTAPTNGAAGIIPAVLRFYVDFIPGANDIGITNFLLTAGAIGILYKEGASISAAEVGCQGEVGVACSMAAAGLAAVLGGTPAQVENAAEIGMEHHLGLTCDPIGGLVQIPCIERNAMGAVQAVAAARLALLGDGQHKVSLDQVIATMRQTGKDMSTIYKETSQGGLAVNVPEC